MEEDKWQRVLSDSLLTEAQREVERLREALQQSNERERDALDLCREAIRIVEARGKAAISIIAILESAKPMGDEVDEPEGSRYIQLSCSLVERMIAMLDSGFVRESNV